jgi:hypothetical protein
MSLVREPTRQKLNAFLVGGAAVAYLSGGLGIWELPYPVVASFVAYRGFTSYRFIGLAWVMHTCWDLVHHYFANPIWPFLPSSSAGCAITDLVLAAWFFLGAPPVRTLKWGNFGLRNQALSERRN